MALALLGSGLTGLTTGPASAVSTDQSYWVPVDKRIELRGHGYGHGHGMSQYGAQGAAMQGRTYREIVDFYYPGTAWSKVRGKVRVLITADTSDDVVVSPAPGLTVRDLGDGSTYPLPEADGVTRWRLVVRDGRAVVQKYVGDRWRRHKLAKGVTGLRGDGEFLAEEPLTLWTPTGSRRYRGKLRAASPAPGSAARDTVNVVTMDEYVMGVVPYEMPASWHPEAVKAQSVAARTYATWSRSQNARRYYQICDTTSCQVYGGVSGEDPRSNAAVEATRRRILTYEGRPAFTQFSSSSGGWTRKGSVPYLPAQEDPFDGWDGNPVHEWRVTVDAGYFERRYPQLGELRRIRVVNRDGNGEWKGRVEAAVLDGTEGNVQISGDAFRWAFGLRSNWFTIEPTPIMSRWQRIGGRRSPVGLVRGREYPVSSGSAQRFDHGRIFYSPRTGARELYGPILKAYRQVGGPDGPLGLPESTVKRRRAGVRTLFEGGAIYSLDRTGTVVLTGPIAVRYLAAGEIKSGLGWPTKPNRKVRNGQRADFERGWIRYFKRSGTTKVNRTR